MRTIHFLSRLKRRLFAALLAAAVCGAAASAAQAAAAEPVTIRFVAKINGAPFDCSKKYAHVGRTDSTYAPQDFRMYISGVSLVRADGSRVPVQLRDDGLWQQQNVALLDFENAAGTCQNGTPQTRTVIIGDAPPHDDYTGLAFRMAVPFALDHQDASSATAPFDQAGLFWGWQAGYKFLTLDGRVNDRHGYSVHVASTGCQMDKPGQVTSCQAPNEADVLLTGFRADKNVVVADIGKLLCQSTLEPERQLYVHGKPHPQMALPNGCMSEPYNSNCAPIFDALGLSFGPAARKSAPQTFFSVQ